MAAGAFEAEAFEAEALAAGAFFAGASAPLLWPSAVVPEMKLATPSAVRRTSASRASTSRRTWRPPKVTAT